MVIHNSNEIIDDVINFGVNKDTPKNDSENFGINEYIPKNNAENFGINENIPKNDTENFGINETQKQILKFISDNPQITAEEMAYKMKQTKRNVEYNIKVLKSKGIIERFGSKKTGKYRIVTM